MTVVIAIAAGLLVLGGVIFCGVAGHSLREGDEDSLPAVSMLIGMAMHIAALWLATLL